MTEKKALQKATVTDASKVSDLLDTLEQIARGACLDQVIGEDSCRCYSCIAKAAIIKATETG